MQAKIYSLICHSQLLYSFGVLSEQSQLQWPLFVVQHPFSTQNYCWTTALRCQIQCCANTQSVHPPLCQMPACPGTAHLKYKESESSLQLPQVSTWLMGPPSSKWVCLLAHSFCRIQQKQAAKTLPSHARACCHTICSFSGIRKCQTLGKQLGSSRPIWSLKRPR